MIRPECGFSNILHITVTITSDVTVGVNGIGLAKKEYLKADLGETLIALQRQIKQVFDPKNILNPGKVF